MFPILPILLCVFGLAVAVLPPIEADFDDEPPRPFPWPLAVGSGLIAAAVYIALT
jgi:hypothetical protein